MLSDFGQEVQGIEHLEVARGTGEQFRIVRLQESTRRVVLGQVRRLGIVNMNSRCGTSAIPNKPNVTVTERAPSVQPRTS